MGCDGRRRADDGRRLICVRRSRVVLAPRPWRLSTPARAGVATVTINAAHRGEHEANRKTIARGKPVSLAELVVTNWWACFFVALQAAGAVSARLSLRPFFGEGQRIRIARAG